MDVLLSERNASDFISARSTRKLLNIPWSPGFNLCAHPEGMLNRGEKQSPPEQAHAHIECRQHYFPFPVGLL